MNARLRKVIKTRGHFPSNDAATKMIWLALRNITADWRRAAHNGKTAMNPFEILCEDRFTKGVAQCDEQLSQRAGRYVASAVRGRGKVSHRLTH